MIRLLRQGFVIARRDFMAVVATPTFLLFLLTPFLLLAISVASGLGGAYLAKGNERSEQMVVIADDIQAARIRSEEAILRERLYGYSGGPPEIRYIIPSGDPAAQQSAMLSRKDTTVTATMRGPLDRPIIVHQQGNAGDARYLALLSEEIMRTERLGASGTRALSRPQISEVRKTIATKARQQSTGSGAVLIMFMLTIMLASQAVGTLAEEKSNKVIEILAASVPLESVFLGKLMGLFGIATVFIAFWGTLATFGVSVVPASAGLASFEPVIGLPLFITFAALYFALAFMLLGAVFLGVGAQASTIREIQMLSLPITLFQLMMFGISMAAAGAPGSTLARAAEIFPFSSPFAMAARGATDAAVWPHIVALIWQALWVGAAIWFSAQLFRYGVLKSGVGPFTAIKRKLMGKPVA